MTTTSPTETPSSTADQHVAGPASLPGTRLSFDQVVPRVPFAAADTGEDVRPTDFRLRRALVLAFVHDNCAPCTTWAEQAVERLAGRRDAEIRIVAPRTGPQTNRELVWTDPHNCRGRLLTDPDVPATLVLDRYAAVQEVMVAQDHDLLSPEQVQGTLDHLDMLCDDCTGDG